MHTVFHIAWGISKHLAFGYLVYSIVQRLRGEAPTGPQSGMLFVGIVFPDVVDKLLVVLGVLPYGRAFAHSLFTTAFLLLLVRVVVLKWGHAALGRAFGLGYLSHLPVDMYGTLLTGSQSMDTAFLFWPILVEYPLPLATPALPVGKQTVFAIVIGSGLVVWVYDEAPTLRWSIRVLVTWIRPNR